MQVSIFKAYGPDKVKYGHFWHSRASNSKTNRSIWPNFEIVRDSMPVLVGSKFDQVLIKMKLLVPGTTFSPRESLWRNIAPLMGGYTQLQTEWSDLAQIRI